MRLRTLASLLIVASAALLRPTIIPAQAVHVVVHPTYPAESISASDLARLFTGVHTALPNGQRAMLFDVATARPIYLRRLVRMTDDQFKRHWIREVFTGRPVTPPLTLVSPAEAAERVEQTPGAIALVTGRPVGRVKVLLIDGKDADDPGYPLR